MRTTRKPYPALLLALALWSGLALAKPRCPPSFAHWLEPVPHAIRPGRTHLFPAEARLPLHYELQLAERSGLPIEEVMGITRNFTDQPVMNGSTGLIAKNNELLLDPVSNLIGAYQSGMKRITPGKLTATDLIDLRKSALEKLTFDRKTVEVPLKFKAGTSTFVEGSLHPEVIARLKTYGYHVVPEAPANRPSGFRIFYPDLDAATAEATAMAHLERLAADLNQMVDNRYPPEYITAHAVRELLIIHPFKDGNGRTARLLGQILYQKLTGTTVIFPKSFHRELEHSLDDLTQSLLPPVHYTTSTRDLVTKGYADHRLLPEVAQVGPAHATIQDRPFGSFKFRSRQYRYEELPEATRIPEGSAYDNGITDYPGRLKGQVDFTYFGRPSANPQETQKILSLFFQYGRSSRGKSHRDIRAHADATNKEDMQSGFHQTSMSPVVAEAFAQRPRSPRAGGDEGIVFIIDPKGAETLYLPAFEAATNRPGAFHLGEGELLFSETIAPDRVVGAWVYKKKSRTPHRLVLNPNYRPR